MGGRARVAQRRDIDVVNSQPPPDERGLHSRIGPFDIDWPRTLRYYGGLALATSFELLNPRLGLFIAAVPFISMFDRPLAPGPARFTSHLLQGAAEPVSGTSEGTITLTTPDLPLQRRGSERKQAHEVARDPSVADDGVAGEPHPARRAPRKRAPQSRSRPASDA